MVVVGTWGPTGGCGEKADRVRGLGLAAFELGAGARGRALPACLHLQGERATGVKLGPYLVLAGAAGRRSPCAEDSMEEWSRPRGRGLSGRGVGLPSGAGSFRERGGAVPKGGAFPGRRYCQGAGPGTHGQVGCLRRMRPCPRGGGVFLGAGPGTGRHLGCGCPPGVWETVLQAHLQAGLSPGSGHCDLPRLPEAPCHRGQPGLVLRPGWKEVRPRGQGGGDRPVHGSWPVGLGPHLRGAHLPSLVSTGGVVRFEFWGTTNDLARDGTSSLWFCFTARPMLSPLACLSPGSGHP